MGLRDHIDYSPISKFEPLQDGKENFEDFAVIIEDYFDQDYGRYEYDREKGVLTLATGGWSYNEAVIAAIEMNSMAMTMWWQKSERGGLHVFARQMGAT